MGRVYLPREDFKKFGSDPRHIGEQQSSPELVALLRFEAERAWQFYREGWKLLSLVSNDSRAALWALARIYSGILEKIEARNYAVLVPPPARLTTAEKVWILVRARIGWLGETNALRNRERDRRRTGGPVGRPGAR
jgi:15-cis-phytoene synthase